MTKTIPGADIALRQLRRRSSLNLGAGGLGPFVPTTAAERAKAKRDKKKGARAKSRHTFFHRGKSYSVLGPFTLEGFLDLAVVEPAGRRTC